MSHRQHAFNPHDRVNDNREPEFTPDSKVSANARAAWAFTVALVLAGGSAVLVWSQLRESIKTAQTTADSAKEDAKQIKTDLKETKADVKEIGLDVKKILERRNP